LNLNRNKEILILIDYRLKQARESLAEAELLLKEAMSLRSVMNRAYYAMFYAVLALLQEKNIGTSKHSGVIAMFDKHYVKTGIFKKNMSKTIHRSFELRQKGDYMEETEVSKEDIDEMLPQACNFVSEVELYLRNKHNK